MSKSKIKFILFILFIGGFIVLLLKGIEAEKNYQEAADKMEQLK